jgi:hypothetical protein
LEEIKSIDPASELKVSIEKSIIKVKNDYKEYLDESKKIINPYTIIDKFKDYLISRIPDVINQLKTGQGGAKFAYDCYIFIKNLITNEIKDIGMMKKVAIKVSAGNKEDAKKEMTQKDVSEYTQIFNNIVDFAFAIGWMDEMKKYEDNVLKWEKENNDWIDKNGHTIRIDIINTIINNLYS